MLRCRALRDLCAVHAGDMLRVHEIRRQTRRELAAVNGATQSRRRVALMRGIVVSWNMPKPMSVTVSGAKQPRALGILR